MTKTTAEIQIEIEKALRELGNQKKFLDGAKEYLKENKPSSERLEKLEEAKKELMKEIKEERDRLENEQIEADEEYKKALHDELKAKNNIKELTASIKNLLTEYQSTSGKRTLNLDINFGNHFLKIMSQISAKVFINGKELK